MDVQEGAPCSCLHVPQGIGPEPFNSTLLGDMTYSISCAKYNGGKVHKVLFPTSEKPVVPESEHSVFTVSQVSLIRHKRSTY